MSHDRPGRELYYCQIALAVAARGTCLRRRYGAVITNANMTEIVSTGYAGAPRGTDNCVDMGSCLRQDLKVEEGSRYELCRSVHAEMNAVIHAARRDMIKGNLFLAGVDAETGDIKPDADACRLCKRVIINAGIANVYILTGPDDFRRFDVEGHWIARQHEVLDVPRDGQY